MKLGFLSDAHGCDEAFDRGLQVLAAHGAERVFFLGDAVGYVPGVGIVERLMAQGIESLLGNHDAAALDGRWDRSREPVYQLEQARAALTDAQRRFLETLPSRREIDAPCGRLLLVHGSVKDPLLGYVQPDTELGPEADSLDDEHVAVFMGHTHRAFLREEAGRLWVNVGSCSLPRDGGMLGTVVLFDDESRETRLLRFAVDDALHAAHRRTGVIHPQVLALLERPPEGPLRGERVDPTVFQSTGPG